MRRPRPVQGTVGTQGSEGVNDSSGSGAAVLR